jgi:uncharacterized protein YndB with AHSA1/START domain
MSYEVKKEKWIARPVNEVFQALQEGLLFMNCGASSSSMTLDFRVGGKYRIEFRNHGVVNHGEFLEIIPERKIVFSWCQHFGPDQKPDSQVAIELFGDGPKTRLVLLHTGFRTQEIADQHEFGWNGGISDMTEELQSGQLRFVNSFTAPLAKLFKACEENLVSMKAKVADAKADNKIAASLSEGQAVLAFSEKPDGRSSVEVIHSGLTSEASKKSHRKEWEKFADAITQNLKG